MRHIVFFEWFTTSQVLSVTDPEICPREPDNSRNLRQCVAAIFFCLVLTGEGGSSAPVDPLLTVCMNSRYFNAVTTAEYHDYPLPIHFSTSHFWLGKLSQAKDQLREGKTF